MNDQEKYLKVSVLLAHYNGKQYVEESIKSVINQTYKNWELIIVDDASTDKESIDLLVSLQKKYSFRLIKHHQNQGAAKALQTALANSNGDYISYLSHDDKYEPDKLEYMLGRMGNEMLDALYCNGGTFSETSELTPFPDDEVLQAQKESQLNVTKIISSRDTVGCLLTQGALYKRDVLIELNWIKDRFIIDDWPLTIVIWRDYKTRYDPKLVYHYRLHENNTHKNFWKWWPARIQVIGELIHDKDKLDVLSFMLTDLSRCYKINSQNDESHRLAAAALILAYSKRNENDSLSLLDFNSTSSNYIQQFALKTAKLRNPLNIQNKMTKRTFKILSELIPTKKLKKSVRKKLKI